MSTTIKSLTWAAALLAIPALLSAQEPSTSLPEAMKELAGKVKGVLPDGGGPIVVQQFTGDPQVGSSAGPQVQKELIAQLTGLGVECKSRGTISCKGEYFFHEDSQSVAIQAVVKNRGEILGSPEIKVYNVADMAALLQVTAPLGVSASKAKENIAKAVAKPEVARAEGTGGTPDARVSAVEGGPYAVEICIKQPDGTYKPIPVEDDEGLAFVPMNPNDVYGVRVINKSKFRAAVTVTIDGLNMFEFSTMKDRKAAAKFTVRPGGTALIKGWHVNDQSCAEFTVVDQLNSKAAELQAKAGVSLNNNGLIGTVSASFAVAAHTGEEFPNDELRPRAVPTGTGFGQVIKANYKPAPAGPFRLGAVREQISVRYSRKTPDDLPPPTGD